MILYLFQVDKYVFTISNKLVYSGALQIRCHVKTLIDLQTLNKSKRIFLIFTVNYVTTDHTVTKYDELQVTGRSNGLFVEQDLVRSSELGRSQG